MINLKGMLNRYKEGCESTELYRTRVTPLMESLSYLATAKEMLDNFLAVSADLPVGYGVDDLRKKVTDTLKWLEDYSDQNIDEEIGK